MRKFIFVLLAGSLVVSPAYAQKVRIVVLGSSTAAGNGASVPDSSWVGRTKTYFKSLGQLDTLYNLAFGGTRTEDALPNNGENGSVTRAMALHPDLVIVSFVSNDAVADIPIATTMSNLRTIAKVVTDAGKICWITTPHPRNSFTTFQNNLQKGVRDSTYLQFPGKNLDFWDCLVASDGVSINPIYDYGDGIHCNDAGHFQMYAVVKAANILAPFFPLPLSFVDFTAVRQQEGNLLHWTVGGKGSCPSFEVQRSGNGSDFRPVAEKTSADDGNCTIYSWLDASPPAGRSYYRLKMLSDGAIIYSPIVSIGAGAAQPFALSALFIPESGALLSVHLQTDQNRRITLSVMNAAGSVVRREEGQAFAPSSRFDVPLDGLAKGLYFLHITSSDGKRVTKGFIFR